MQKPTTLQNAPKSLWRSGIRDAAEAGTERRSVLQVAYRAFVVRAIIAVTL
jgi:hypothetical protein